MELVGWQFPGSADAWLMVRIDAETEGRGWSAVDPALEAGDVKALATWLERVHSGEAVARSLGFTEPNLEFELEGEPPSAVRVHFDLEFLPEWKVSRGFAHREPLSIRFPIAALDLPTAAASLRMQLARLPRQSKGS
jgi:hypothetical protein